jgi:subtilisin family serine protease
LKINEGDGMNRKIIAGLAVALFLLSVPGVNAEGHGSSAEKVSVIIGFKDGCHRDPGMPFGADDIYHEFPGLNAVAVSIPQNAVDSLKNNPKVAYVEYDGTATASGEVVPWGVDRIDADVAWGESTGASVKVAVVDTGIDRDHPDLEENILGGTNYVRARGRVDPNRWDDDNGHGTHCAGIIAAVDNEEGVVGVANACGLYGVKVLNSRGSGSISDIVSGIQWAAGQNVDVISMSLSTSGDYQSLHDACDAAEDAGIVVVAAAGNQGDGQASTTEIRYPAAYDSVIAVASIDDSDAVAYSSNSGPHVELAAPGVSVYSTYMDGGYATMSGTSMACPHVAGTAALVIALNPTWTGAQVRQQLIDTAEDLGDVGKDNSFGNGLVDAGAAVGPGEDDENPPVISNVAVSGVSASGATVTWTTDEPSDSLVNYGTSEELGSPAQDAAMVTSHSVTLSGLSEETKYYFEVASTDAWDNTETDDNGGVCYTFTTTAASSNAMHVFSIDMRHTTAGRNIKVYTDVKVVDTSGNGVEGAMVYLDMALPGSGTSSMSGLTGGDGMVTFMYGPTRDRGTFTSTVADVVKDGWTYDDDANAETSEVLTIN